MLGTGGGFLGILQLETPSAKDDLDPEEARENIRWSFLSKLILVLFTDTKKSFPQVEVKANTVLGKLSIL